MERIRGFFSRHSERLAFENIGDLHDDKGMCRHGRVLFVDLYLKVAINEQLFPLRIPDTLPNFRAHGY